MKLTKKAQETEELLIKANQSDDYWELADNLPINVGGSDGFWYNVTDGGYCNVEEVLADEVDIKKVKDAIKTLREFEDIYNAIHPEY